ncbi:hypothetical protein PMAYCL1PPCAC_28105, partial [Pristionchus mayeri]
IRRSSRNRPPTTAINTRRSTAREPTAKERSDTRRTTRSRIAPSSRTTEREESRPKSRRKRRSFSGRRARSRTNLRPSRGAVSPRCPARMPRRSRAVLRRRMWLRSWYRATSPPPCSMPLSTRQRCSRRKAHSTASHTRQRSRSSQERTGDQRSIYPPPSPSASSP